jgi:hypothetical protein
MTANSPQPSQTASAIPPDDPQRNLTLARPNQDERLRHISIGKPR